MTVITLVLVLIIIIIIIVAIPTGIDTQNAQNVTLLYNI